MNIIELQAFIEFYPNGSKLLYQTFDDAKKGREGLTSLSKRLIPENFDKLDKLNQQGAGVFFAVNGFEEQDRKQTKVKYINTRIVEMDHLSKEQQFELIELSPIKPSLIIESNKSLHLYRFAKDGKVENRNKICRGLRNFFDSDPAIITLERIMRLPGFNHLKDEANPFPIVLRGGCQQEYTELEMLTAYSNTETFADKKEKERKLDEYTRKYETNNDDNFWKRAGDINSEVMLELLSGTSYVGGDIITFRTHGGTKQIVVNGKSTPCWIDTTGKIGTQKGSGGGPTRKQRVAWYGNFDGPGLYQLIIEKFPLLKPKSEKLATELIPEKEVNTSIITELTSSFMNDINYNNPNPFTYGLSTIDNVRGKFDYHQLHAIIGESGSGKTTFTFFQAMKNATNNKVLYLSLEMAPPQLLELRARKFAGISASQRACKTFTELQKNIMKSKMEEILNLKNLKLAGGIKDAVLHIDVLLKCFDKYLNAGYTLFYIDNLGYLTGEGNGKDGLDYIIRKCQQYIQNNKCTIVLLHHFNKGTDKTRANRGFQDVMSTAKLEHDIDYGLFVSRETINRDDLSEEERATTRIDIRKDRYNGIINKVPIYFRSGGYVESFSPYNKINDYEKQ